MDNITRLNDIKNLMYEADMLELAQQRMDKLQALLPLMKERVGQVSEKLDALGDIMDAPADYDAPAETEFADDAVPVASESAVRREAVKKPLFCLNDRFKFRREIFGGSDADFDAAMDFLATLETYEEAESYFYNDLGLDPANEDVAEFMDVIKTYYGS